MALIIQTERKIQGPTLIIKINVEFIRNHKNQQLTHKNDKEFKKSEFNIKER